jgi:hypothetical protein
LALDPHQGWHCARRAKCAHPLSCRSALMKLQQLFEKSENVAVAYIVVIFAVLHFGLLYLLNNV